jgi:hypothetical protein
MTADVKFPALIRQNGRLYGERGALENYKRLLAELPPLNLDPNRPVELIPAKQIAAEMGFGRRTLGRRIQGREQGSPNAAESVGA